MSFNNNYNPLLIPSRWLHCPRKGSVLERFLPFKTPLDSRYNDQIEEQFRFDIDMLFQVLQGYKLTVGLIIDLSNTTRYYNKLSVEEKECHYLKLQCKGQAETPTESQTQAFVGTCERFWQKKPAEIIGVHCTHGFNRTGFLIVAFLVEKLSWSVDAAVSKFAQCRPPGIYKQGYMDELFRRYGDADDVPLEPSLPDWCEESDHRSDDDGDVDGSSLGDNHFEGNIASREHSQRSFGNTREIVPKNAKFVEGVLGVVHVTEQRLLSDIQCTCRRMASSKGYGFPGSQPVSLDRHNVELLKQKPYMVSWKADGTRYLMLIDGTDRVYMLDRNNAVFHIQRLRFPRRKDLDSDICDTLVDGEMVVDKVDGKDIARFLIYDIIRFEGQEVGKTDFQRRLLCIEKEIVGPRTTKMQQGRLDRSSQAFGIRVKPFWDIAKSRQVMELQFTDTSASAMTDAWDDPPKRYSCAWTVDKDVGGGLEACGTKPGRIGSMLGDVGALPECEVKTQIALNQTTFQILDGAFSTQVSHGVDGLIFSPVSDIYTCGTCFSLLKWKSSSMNSIDFRLKIHKEQKMGMLPETKGLLFVGHSDQPFAEIKLTSQLKELNNKIVECFWDEQRWVFMRQRTDKSFPNSCSTAMSVWKSISHPVTKQVLFSVVENHRWKANQPLTSDKVLMPPPPSAERRH